MKNANERRLKKFRLTHRLALGLALSAAIHAALWLALFHSRALRPPPAPPGLSVVELIEPGHSKEKDTPSKGRLHTDRDSRARTRSARQAPLAPPSTDGGIAQLLPSFKPKFGADDSGIEAPNQGQPGGTNHHETGNKSGFGSATHQEAYRIAEGLDLQGTLDALPFFDAIWTKIDRSLDFPDEFVKQRRSGTVTIQFEVDHQGRFTGKVYDVRSEEPLLATYALVVLIQSLRSSISQKLWLDRPKAALEATFLFKTYPYRDIPQKKSAPPFKNYLAFDRHAYAEPLVVEKLDRFIAKYVPPVVPIPGGVYIDFVQAYKMYKAWTEPDPVDVRQQRMELLVERLRAEINRAENAKARPDVPTGTPSDVPSS